MSTTEHPLTTLRFEHSPRYPTKGDLARAAGVSRVTVHRAEQDEPLGFLTATKIAAALGLTVEQLAEKLSPGQVRTIDSPDPRSKAQA